MAIPRRFLEALGVAPLSKVQVAQEKGAIVIRKSPMARMSDEEFEGFLSRIRQRNKRITPRQVAESIRQVRRPA